MLYHIFCLDNIGKYRVMKKWSASNASIDLLKNVGTKISLAKFCEVHIFNRKYK